MKSKFKITATISEDLVNQIRNYFDIENIVDEDGKLTAVWVINEEYLYDFLDKLSDFGIHDFLLQESAIHYYLVVDKVISQEIEREIICSINDRINSFDELFTGEIVLSFISRSEFFDTIRQIINKFNIKRFFGIECFTVVKEIPTCTKNISSQLH